MKARIVKVEAVASVPQTCTVAGLRGKEVGSEMVLWLSANENPSQRDYKKQNIKIVSVYESVPI